MLEHREAFRIQEFYCRNMDAPIYARLCAAIAVGLTRDSRTGARILDWPGEPHAQNVMAETGDSSPPGEGGGLRGLLRRKP